MPHTPRVRIHLLGAQRLTLSIRSGLLLKLLQLIPHRGEFNMQSSGNQCQFEVLYQRKQTRRLCNNGVKTTRVIK